MRCGTAEHPCQRGPWSSRAGWDSRQLGGQRDRVPKDVAGLQVPRYPMGCRVPAPGTGMGAPGWQDSSWTRRGILGALEKMPCQGVGVWGRRAAAPPAHVLLQQGLPYLPASTGHLPAAPGHGSPAQPSPGNPPVVSEAVGSPDQAHCQHKAPQHVPSMVWPWELAGRAAPGCTRGSLCLSVCAWAGLCSTALAEAAGPAPLAALGWQGIFQGLPHFKLCICPSLLETPLGLSEKLGALGAGSGQVPGRHLQTKGGRAGRSAGNRRGLFLEKHKSL